MANDDEFDPLTGDPLPKSNKPPIVPKDTQSPLSPAELAKLEDMGREELIALIRSVAGAIWGYAMLDDEQKAEAARLKLYNMGMSATEVHKVVPALDKWFDRTLGKPAQTQVIEMKGSVDHNVMLPATRQWLESIGICQPIIDQ